MLLMSLYYSLKYPTFLRILNTLFWLYIFKYSYSKYHLECMQSTLPSNLLTYGRFSLKSLTQSFSYAPLSKDSFFLDLGCGHGEAVFFSHLSSGCQARGIDIIPSFIRFATIAAKKHSLFKVDFKEEDFLTQHYPQATHVLISLTCATDKILETVKKNIPSFSSNCVLIAVGRPILHPLLALIKTFKGKSSWGKTRVYIYRKIDHIESP